jgi:ribosomal protein L37AE/L43A
MLELQNNIELQNQKTDQILNNLFEWLVRYTYFYGAGNALRANKSEKGNVYWYEITPKYKELSFGWRNWYGSTEVFIRDHDEFWNEFPSSWNIDRFHVWHHDDNYFYKKDNFGKAYFSLGGGFWDQLANEVNVAIVRFFPGIKQINNYCKCDVCNQSGIHDFVAGRWICDDCQDKYLLVENVQVYGVNRKEKDERAKLTKSLRFEILEHDDFTCQLCGRSPLKGDDVKLHIDHKYPIAKGGKTEKNNLHVLCEDCNLGKGTKVIDQLEMFDCA